jgi:hypothetical protein
MINDIERPKKDEWQFYAMLIWVFTLFAFLWMKWAQIDAFLLADTDDNMRMVQVRDWIAGQGWFDLRQYRLSAPIGADMHWSRIVDIPLAAIIVILTPLFGTAAAETAAVAIAPMLPLAITFIALGSVARRTVAPMAWLIAIGLILSTTATLRMFMPMRIDHHGWQLASLSILVAGLVDPAKRRGGALVGGGTALSLGIGLEMLPFLALGAVVVGLRWVLDRSEAERLMAYGAALGAGTGLAFLLFASNANWAPMCDVLSPVWLSVMVLAGALLFALAQLRISSPLARLGLITAAGLIVTSIILIAFPQCLSRPEGLSPDAERLWFQNVREVKSLFQQGMNTVVTTLMLPIAGLIGCALMLWRERERWVKSHWVPLLVLSLVSALMLLWQSRVSAVAQLLAIPGATALAWFAFIQLRRSASLLVRTVGVVVVFLAISGLGSVLLISARPLETPTAERKLINTAFAQCMARPNLRALNRIPAATMLTFVDLAPRLLAETHHSALAGPYHRNDDAIVAVHKAFGETAEKARATALKYGATFVLICPNMAEATLHKSRSPEGFYAQITASKIPAWMTPVPLPDNAPFRLWAIAP